LGIRLQCAQCHKHPFAPWTQDDFKQFSAFFESVRYGVAPATDPRYRQLAAKVGLNLRGDQGAAVRSDLLKRSGDDKLVPWRELYIAERDKPVSLSLLRSGTADIAAHEDPRGVIMQWMKRPEHPWFARALVNRVWASYFGVGIIDPPEQCDDGNTVGDDECDNSCQTVTQTTPLEGQIKLKVGLRFDKMQSDAISLGIKGLALPDTFVAAGSDVRVDVGGAVLDVPLDDKGRYKSPDKRDRLKLKQKKRDGTWKLSLKRKKNDFAATLADEGLVDEDNKEGKSAGIAVSVDAGGVGHAAEHGVTYRSKAGKKGKARTAN